MFDFLKVRKAKTAAELAEGVEAAKLALAAERTAHADCVARRGKVLLNDDDAALDNLEAEILSHARQAERLEAAIVELDERQNEATKREQEQEFERGHLETQKRADRGVAILKGLELAFEEIAVELDELGDIEILTSRWNARMTEAGQKDFFVEKPGGVFAGGGRWREIRSLVVLPVVRGGYGTVWPRKAAPARIALVADDQASEVA